MATCGKRYLRASLEEDERLTEEVKKFPSLYDKRGKDYKDRNVTTNYWTEVATSLYILDDEDEFVICFRDMIIVVTLCLPRFLIRIIKTACRN